MSSCASKSYISIVICRESGFLIHTAKNHPFDFEPRVQVLDSQRERVYRERRVALTASADELSGVMRRLYISQLIPNFSCASLLYASMYVFVHIHESLN